MVVILAYFGCSLSVAALYFLFFLSCLFSCVVGGCGILSPLFNLRVAENQVPVKLQGVNNEQTANELKFDQAQSSYVAKW